MNGDWYRLEGSNRAATLEPGLSAYIADALWMLARQWQVGEFRGEDAGRPLHARYEVERLPLSHGFVDPDDVTADSAIPLPENGGPVEVYLEREPLTTGPAALAFAAEAGVQLARTLRLHGVSPKTRAAIASQYALDPEATTGVMRIMTSRAPNGAEAYAARAKLHLLAIIPEKERDVVESAVAAWATWYDARVDEPSKDAAPMWRDETLAYRFALGTRRAEKGNSIVLSADDHTGGTLDWHAFDLTTRPVKLETSVVETEEHELNPTPVAFAGMAAPRFWSFEANEVHFGGVSSGPADLARIVVAEHASVFANDFWMLPVRGRAGHLQRVTRLEVIDSFGEIHDVEAAAVLDGATRPWKFFELTGDASSNAGLAPWLPLFDNAYGLVEGEPVERVEFVRDEQSNLGWAGEAVYEASDGRRTRRMDAWRAVQAELPGSEPAAEVDSDIWAYRLNGGAPPPHWTPLVPERPNPTTAAVVLRRGRLREWDTLPEDVRRLKGRILTPEKPFAIDEVELPRSGLTVTRSYHAARDRDGRLRLWAGRRKRLGRGERTLGERSDRLVGA